MTNSELLTIEILGRSKGSRAVVLDRVIGGTVYLDEAKRIGHRLLAITDGAPNAFRIVSPLHQLLYEWHVGEKKKN